MIQNFSTKKCYILTVLWYGPVNKEISNTEAGPVIILGVNTY